MIAAADVGLARFRIDPVPPIDGLRYEKKFLSHDDQVTLLDNIDAAPDGWSTVSLRTARSRRFQQYGWRYDYVTGQVSETEPIPEFFASVIQSLIGYMPSEPTQIIVNEYLPGQGISPHIDGNVFGDAVASLSLGDRWEMEFTKGDMTHGMYLAKGSLVCLAGSARWEWKHGIKPRKTDGDGRTRKRRVSVTFRTVCHD